MSRTVSGLNGVHAPRKKNQALQFISSICIISYLEGWCSRGQLIIFQNFSKTEIERFRSSSNVVKKE